MRQDMELISLAVVVGSVGASAFVQARTEQIVDAIDECFKSVTRGDDTFIADRKRNKNNTEQAVLSLD